MEQEIDLEFRYGNFDLIVGIEESRKSLVNFHLFEK